MTMREKFSFTGRYTTVSRDRADARPITESY
jgi:hypothetical protein